MFGTGRHIIIAVTLFASPMLAKASEPSVKQDCSQAEKLREDADHNDRVAEFQLGRLYVSGTCVVQNLQTGVVWMTRSAMLGYAPAEVFVATSYHMERQDEEAAVWARRAADQGNSAGEGLLAYLYDKGKGVKQDNDEAAKWARAAAEQGSELGQLVFGQLYEYGYGGLPKDMVEADKWYLLAEKNRGGDINKDAIAARKRSELKMTRKERAEARTRADAWKPRPGSKPWMEQ